MLKMKEKLEHENDCDYNQLLCPMDEKCSFALSFIDLKKHLLKKHSMPTVKSPNGEVTIRNFYQCVSDSPKKHFKYHFGLIHYDHLFEFQIFVFRYELVVCLDITPLVFEMLKEVDQIEVFTILYEFKDIPDTTNYNDDDEDYVPIPRKPCISTIFRVEDKIISFPADETLLLKISVTPYIR